jgi:hypothetical protein
MRGSRLAFVLPRILTPTSWLVLSAGGRLARTREVAAQWGPVNAGMISVENRLTLCLVDSPP